MRSKDILGDEVRKIDPNLRVYADSKIDVNIIRAEHSANLKVPRNEHTTKVPCTISATPEMVEKQRASYRVATTDQPDAILPSSQQTPPAPVPARKPAPIEDIKDIEGA